jgi:hypothetical protein
MTSCTDLDKTSRSAGTVKASSNLVQNAFGSQMSMFVITGKTIYSRVAMQKNNLLKYLQFRWKST